MNQIAEQHKTLVSVILALLIVGAAAYFYTIGEAPGRDSVTIPEPKMIQIKDICEQSLAYTTLPEGTSTEVYLKECVDGKYPNVVETYLNNMKKEGTEAQ